MTTVGGGATGASSTGTSRFGRAVGLMIGRGGRTASFFFSGCGLSSRMITLRVRVRSFLPVIRA
jgi:hypothetical protein